MTTISSPLDNLLAAISKYGKNPQTSSFGTVGEETNYYNAYADYFRYFIGINCIPAKTIIKKIFVPWLRYQSEPILEEQHSEWKRVGAYKDGIAIMPGKVWHRPDKQRLYFTSIDADKIQAIAELWTRNEKRASLEEVAQKFLTEQHDDDVGRVHFGFYSPIPFPKKSPDEYTGIEVKGLGEHGVVYSACSIHQNTDSKDQREFRYQIMGTLEPITLTELQAKEFIQHINNICKKHGVDYLERHYGSLLDSQSKIYQGSRHDSMLRIADSLLFRYGGNGKTEEELKNICIEINKNRSEPPLASSEINRIWRDAVDYYKRKKGEQQRDWGGGGSIPEHSDDTEDSPRKRIVSLTDMLSDRYVFKTMRDTVEIYCYDEDRGIFVDEGKSVIQTKCEITDPNISTHEVNEVTNHIRRRTLSDRSQFDVQIEWLTCQNCMINMKTLDTKPHTSELMSTIQIPVMYNIEFSNFADFFEWVGDNIACPCPAIIEFMHQVMSDDDVETVLDMIAYCLWRGFPFHRYMLFNGSGRNGKGVMLEVIRRFLGSRNVSGESLHQILNNRFSVARLYGKMANIDADLSKDALKNTGILKKLTGGDLIRAEEKFMPPFDFVNHAKLFFSANEFPISDDETDAFFVRLIIVNFPNQFLGDKAVLHLIDKLTTEEELSGLLRLTLRRLPGVLKEGIRTASSTINENYTKYILSSDPVRAFVEVALERDSDILALKDEVYNSYKMFCTAKNLATESEQSFSRKMTKQHGFRYEQIRDDKGGRPYYYVGVRIRDWKAAEEGQSTL